MKFLVDAHLPRGLCAVLQAAGHDAVHTRQPPAHDRTTDQVINEVSVAEQRVVISKDTGSIKGPGCALKTAQPPAAPAWFSASPCSRPRAGHDAARQEIG